jgi:hypothetical protein
MEFATCRLETYQTFGNSHAVCRHETWNFKAGPKFADLATAERYIINMNADLPEFIMASRGLTDDAKLEFAREFSFGKKYLHHCRYFLYPPPKADIIACLKANGIEVEH